MSTKEAIVDKHVQVLLMELRASGHDVMGIAGCVMHYGTEDGPSQAHTFYNMEEGATTATGAPVSGTKFLHDAANIMLRIASGQHH